MYCYVCRRFLPPAFLDNHHVKPQSVGLRADNSEQNRKEVCPLCHQGLHRMVAQLLKGNDGAVADLAAILFADDNAGAEKRIVGLARIVARETILMREGEREMPEVMRVSFEIPRSVYMRLRVMGMEFNAGRPGMAPLLRSLVTRMTDKHFSLRSQPPSQGVGGSSPIRFDETNFI